MQSDYVCMRVSSSSSSSSHTVITRGYHAQGYHTRFRATFSPDPILSRATYLSAAYRRDCGNASAVVSRLLTECFTRGIGCLLQEVTLIHRDIHRDLEKFEADLRAVKQTLSMLPKDFARFCKRCSEVLGQRR